MGLQILQHRPLLILVTLTGDLKILKDADIARLVQNLKQVLVLPLVETKILEGVLVFALFAHDPKLKRLDKFGILYFFSDHIYEFFLLDVEDIRRIFIR